MLTTTKEPNNKFLAEYVKLNPPVIEGGMGLYDALAQRQSKRDFEAGTQLTLDELSQILWAGYGPNRDSGLRTVPSNKGKLGIDVYVFLEKGTYKYLPMEQKMEVINNRDYRAITGRDPWVPDASANFCFVGVLERESFHYVFWINRRRRTIADMKNIEIGQVTKSAGRMPWHQSPMKDVTSCDKPWGGANIL